MDKTISNANEQPETKAGRILVVDDTKINRDVLCRRLKSHNFTCTEAESAEAALELIDAESFDLVLLDINMPDIDGFEALKIIRKKFSSSILPVVMVTALTESSNIVQAFKLGANDYVTKPIDFPVALARINSVINTKRIEEAFKEQAIELKKSQIEAILASKAKSHFLSSMSHEIRTPLNAILGMTELLEESKLDQEQVKYIDSISRAGNTLLGLINNILDLSKIESGIMDLETIKFDLADAIKTIQLIFIPIAKDNGTKIELDISNDFRQYVEGDLVRIKQVIINLVGNAIKFTKNGTITVHAESKRVASTQDEFTITVEDTGIGIPENKLEDIFQNFTQADSCVTRQYGGTGLGLAICKKLAEKMNGKIWAESTVGKGSRFIFQLRLNSFDSSDSSFAETTYKDNENVADLKVVEGTNDENTDKSEGLSGKILLVDDSEDNRELVLAFLKKSSYEIITATNGEEAVNAFCKQQDFDLVLMDMQMPVLDGYSATQQIRKWETENSNTQVPIIALTAFALKEEEQKSIKAGCSAHMSKPIKKKLLLAEIEKHICALKEFKKTA